MSNSHLALKLATLFDWPLDFAPLLKARLSNWVLMCEQRCSVGLQDRNMDCKFQLGEIIYIHAHQQKRQQ